ncbi:hypothetical protein CJF32_00005552 [Rutstroemia sp. NJR-2017a WRK4]|nr:hypothetical protein CJF32_00005552 [Rutstroemia sp. NJR-2017a WRK4]
MDDDKNHLEMGVLDRTASSNEACDIPSSRLKGNTSRDDQEMAYYGKPQQLKRNFGFLSIAGFVCSLLSTWEWWLTVIGWQAGQASVAFLCATMIQGVVVLNHPDYVPERWQATLILYAILAFMLFINTFLSRWLPKIEGLVLCVHILGFFGILIPLVYLAPHGSAKDVFTTFLNEGKWQTDGVSFFVGLVTSVVSFLGTDSACHMSEEIINSSTVVPKAMIWSIMLNGVMGFALLIALLFCLGNIDDALTSPTGFPFMEIFVQATDSNSAATGMTAVLLFMIIAAEIGVMATASRQLWAFARDNGVPGSKYISRVHEPTGVPIYSIVVGTVVSLLLALINIGSTAAFTSIVSVNVAAFSTSYIIPICLLLKKRLRQDPVKDKIHWGPWQMGPVLGPIVNIIGLVYSIIAMFFSFWPAVAEVDKVSMNWSCVLFAGALLFSIVFYIGWGKHAYKWPIVDPIKRQQ